MDPGSRSLLQAYPKTVAAIAIGVSTILVLGSYNIWNVKYCEICHQPATQLVIGGEPEKTPQIHYYCKTHFDELLGRGL